MEVEWNFYKKTGKEQNQTCCIKAHEPASELVCLGLPITSRCASNKERKIEGQEEIHLRVGGVIEDL